jgi:hypothetical protein
MNSRYSQLILSHSSNRSSSIISQKKLVSQTLKTPKLAQKRVIYIEDPSIFQLSVSNSYITVKEQTERVSILYEGLLSLNLPIVMIVSQGAEKDSPFEIEKEYIPRNIRQRMDIHWIHFQPITENKILKHLVHIRSKSGFIFVYLSNIVFHHFPFRF